MTLNDGSSVTIVVNQSYNHQQIQTLTDHFCRIVASLFIDLKCVLNKHKVRFKSVHVDTYFENTLNAISCSHLGGWNQKNVLRL